MFQQKHALIILLASGLAACGESSTLSVSDGTGPSPKLPEPNKTLLPTVNIDPRRRLATGQQTCSRERHSGQCICRRSGSSTLAVCIAQR